MNEYWLNFEWIPVLSEEANRYLFPDPISRFFKSQYSGPAVYRWTVSESDKLLMAYYGEAENLARRADGYRRGHEGQKTNARIKALFSSLGSHLTIGLDRLRFEPFLINGIEINERSLNKKDVRCFLENAMIVTSPSEVQLLNKATSLDAKQIEKVKSILAKLPDDKRQIVLNQILRKARK